MLPASRREGDVVQILTRRLCRVHGMQRVMLGNSIPACNIQFNFVTFFRFKHGPKYYFVKRENICKIFWKFVQMFRLETFALLCTVVETFDHTNNYACFTHSRCFRRQT